MAKAKHPKLPNGFGSIKKLSGKNRTNPYGVYPPTKEFSPNGSPITPKALCYVPDWYTGFYALMEYKNGTFDPDKFALTTLNTSDSHNEIISKIIASYNRKNLGNREKKTFSNVFDLFYAYKYQRPNGKTYSRQSKDSTNAAFKKCSTLHDELFEEINADQLQRVIDECPNRYATKENIVSLFKQMYRYAYANNLCDRDISVNLSINTADDDEKGEPFTAENIRTFWKHANDNTIVQSILIMIYSGFRISEYSNLEINHTEKYFHGGIKTAAGKNRIVPFYEPIIPYIDSCIELFSCRPYEFRTLFKDELLRLGIKEKHTPHDCRHTFSWLCDKYDVNTLSKKIMMGHSLGNNVTDSRYGHRTIEELRTEIQKIQKDCH